MQELSATDVTANSLTGLGIDVYFTRTDSAGTRAFLPDALGSTLALADNTGTVQTSYTYEPFGNTAVSGAASSNSFQYTGRENDGTGLYYYRARYYHPRLQRFISEDPLALLAGPNFYAYVINNPITFMDPLGLELTLGQQLTVSLISSVWSAVGSVLLPGGPIVGGAVGGAFAGFVATAVLGGTLTDAGNAAVEGALSGVVGGTVGKVFGKLGANNIQIGSITGVIS